MNLNPSSDPTSMSVDIDALLQDSYLLVVELRQGACALNTDKLSALCIKQIELVRRLLKEAGLSSRSIDHISHAQCALLDETVLGRGKDEDHAKWARKPLQARFFNRHQAGEFLYEDMREVLREPSADQHVLTAFHRVLMLGFQGRYRDANDPEREQLVVALAARVAPLKLSHTLPTHVNVGRRMKAFYWLRSPLAHVLAASLLLVGVWWGLDHLLNGVIASLSSVQA